MVVRRGALAHVEEQLMTALRGARIFVTGHTGFKGSWLIATLRECGAEVIGYSLPAPTVPSLFVEAKLEADVTHYEADIRDCENLTSVMRDCSPDAVVHLAAQPLVFDAYADPAGTFATNVQGTVNVLEAVRRTPSVRSAIIVTTDKCYEPNHEIALRETDRLGGDEPYSASKACAELAVSAYRHSYFNGGAVVASARAGNVIGGGDWASHRLLADLARAMVGERRVILRNPAAIRPWQHVFDAISGYLLLINRALQGDRTVAKAWNFGPDEAGHLNVLGVVDAFAQAYHSRIDTVIEPAAFAENPTLRLDSTQARRELGWQPVLPAAEAVATAAQWYRRRADGEPVRELLYDQVRELMMLTNQNQTVEEAKS